MTYIKIKVHKLDGGAGCFGIGCKGSPQVVEPKNKPDKNVYIKKIDRDINKINKSFNKYLKKCKKHLEDLKKLKIKLKSDANKLDNENRKEKIKNLAKQKLILYKTCNKNKDKSKKLLEILKKQREQMLKDNFTNKEIRELERLQADIDAKEELDELMKQNPLTRSDSASEGIIKIKVLKLSYKK